MGLGAVDRGFLPDKTLSGIQVVLALCPLVICSPCQSLSYMEMPIFDHLVIESVLERSFSLCCFFSPSSFSVVSCWVLHPFYVLLFLVLFAYSWANIKFF